MTKPSNRFFGSPRGFALTTMINRLVSILLCFAIGGVLSVALGQDANWDLKNYHLYNAFSFLEGRLELDLFAAGIQTYFHPLLDVPYYLLSMGLFSEHPRTLAFFMGLPYGLVVYCTYKIALNVMHSFETDVWAVNISSAAAVLFGVTGVALISQTGTTFNEVTLAALLLWGLMILVSGMREREDIGWSALMQAGFLFGVTAGLKLTAAIYAPAAALSIFLTGRCFKSALQRTVVFCIAWAVAFVLIWGWWGWRLFDLTGNPLFPMFNSVFQSEWIGEQSGMDNRFKPKFLLQALFYPFFWIKNDVMTVAEPQFSDPRFALGFVAFFGLLILRLFPTRTNTPHGGAETLEKTSHNKSRVSDFIFVFVLIGYVIWEALFSILRYAATLESLLGVFVFSLLIQLTQRIEKSVRTRLLSVSTALVLGFTSVFTTYPEWGRAGYSKKVFDVPAVSLGKNSLVLFFSKPLAFTAPFLWLSNPDVRFIGIEPAILGLMNHQLGRNISSGIASHEGPIYVLTRKLDLGSAREVLEKFDLLGDMDGCGLLKSNIDEDFVICPLRKGGTETKRYSLGETFSFRASSQNLGVGMQGWSAPEEWGRWSDGFSASIRIPLYEISSASFYVELYSRAFITPEHPRFEVKIFANGLYVDTLAYEHPRDREDQVRKIFVPHDAVEAEPGELKMTFEMVNPVAPRALGVSADERILGLGLGWLKLTAATQ